jgi:nitronate monooxygenase
VLTTPFADLVGCSRPVQAAPFSSHPPFLSSVAAAGALPMMGTGTEPPGPDALVERVEAVRALTAAPFGVNFLVPFLDLGAVEAVAPLVRVVECFFGDPDPAVVNVAHRGGALAGWQVGSAEEAARAADAGCDLVVAQGIEAGGHVRGTTDMRTLLGAVVERIDVPVIAAGTIATGADMAAALAAGAAAVRLGTRLVASTESLAHPHYKQAIVEATAGETMLTDTFGRDWPKAPHRVLRSCVEAVHRVEDDVVAETALGEVRIPMLRFSTTPPSVHTTGAVEAMALYAGESVDGIADVRPVAEIIADMCAEAEALLAR